MSKSGPSAIMHTMQGKRLINTILGLLVLQFILGMLANLYASIPEQRPYEVFHQFGYIFLHLLNGVALVVLGIILVQRSRRQGGLGWASAGLGNVLLAFMFGEIFVFTQNDIFSLLMAVAFIGALLSYARIAFPATEAEK